MTRDRLSEREARFVDEYPVDLNGTKAAIRAGYAEKSAHVTASRLLRNAKVSEAIRVRLAERAEKVEVSAERVLAELARIGLSDIRRVFDAEGLLLHPAAWPDDFAAAVSSIEVVTTSLPAKDGEAVEVEHTHKIRLWPKVAALEGLARHLGLYRTPGDAPDNPLHVAEATDQQRLAAIALMAARAMKGES